MRKMITDSVQTEMVLVHMCAPHPSPGPTLLPISYFKSLSSVVSCTPKNNHGQCHMVEKIKASSFEYISS